MQNQYRYANFLIWNLTLINSLNHFAESRFANSRMDSKEKSIWDKPIIKITYHIHKRLGGWIKIDVWIKFRYIKSEWILGHAGEEFTYPILK